MWPDTVRGGGFPSHGPAASRSVVIWIGDQRSVVMALVTLILVTLMV